MFYMYASLIAATLIIAAAAEDFDRAPVPGVDDWTTDPVGFPVKEESSVWLLDDAQDAEKKPDLLIQPLPLASSRKRAAYTLRLCRLLGPHRLCNGDELTAVISEAQDSGGLGDRVWSSAMALSIWMARPEQKLLFGGKRVLELGSGVGLSGVVASLLPNDGARPASVLLSDHSQFLLKALHENVRASAEFTIASGGVLDKGATKVAMLNWDRCQDSGWAPPETAAYADVIIAADVVYARSRSCEFLK